MLCFIKYCKMLYHFFLLNFNNTIQYNNTAAFECEVFEKQQPAFVMQQKTPAEGMADGMVKTVET